MKKYNHLVRSLFCIILIIILQIPTSAKLTYSKIATFSEAYIPSEDAVNYDFLDPIEDNSIKPMEREISDTDNRKELNNLIDIYKEKKGPFNPYYLQKYYQMYIAMSKKKIKS